MNQVSPWSTSSNIEVNNIEPNESVVNVPIKDDSYYHHFIFRNQPTHTEWTHPDTTNFSTITYEDMEWIQNYVIRHLQVPLEEGGKKDVIIHFIYSSAGRRVE